MQSFGAGWASMNESDFTEKLAVWGKVNENEDRAAKSVKEVKERSGDVAANRSGEEVVVYQSGEKVVVYQSGEEIVVYQNGGEVLVKENEGFVKIYDHI